MPAFTPSELLRAQDKFFDNLTRLQRAIKIRHPAWLVKAMEVGVQKQRKGLGGAEYQDAVHMATSLHYEGLAADLAIFVPIIGNTRGLYMQIEFADDPVWTEIHDLWAAIDPLNNSRIKGDACHVSRDPQTGDPRA